MQLTRRDPALIWLPVALSLAAVLGILAGWNAPPPNHDLGFAGTPTWLRLFIITDLTLVISVWAGLANNLNVKVFGFQMLLPMESLRIWRSRLLAGYIGMFGPLLLATLLFCAISGDYYSPGFLMWLRFVMVLALLPALVQAAGAFLDREFVSIRSSLWFGAGAVVLLSEWMVGWLLPSLWLTAAVVAVLIFVLLTWTSRRLPVQFQWRQNQTGVEESKHRESREALIPQWLQIPIVSPWARLNRYLAADPLVRLNMYVVMLGAIAMVWGASRAGNTYSIFEMAFLQGFFLVFAIFGLPRVAFLPVPKWRIFLQGIGQGYILVLISLLMLLISGRLELPSDGFLTATVAAVTLLWFTVWFLSTTAFIHFFITYPARRWPRRLSWVFKILHGIAACVPTFWAMPGDLPEPVPDILELHQALAAWLPEGALAWVVAAPIIAALYWVALRLFQRIEVTRLKDRLVKAK